MESQVGYCHVLKKINQTSILVSYVAINSVNFQMSITSLLSWSN